MPETGPEIQNLNPESADARRIRAVFRNPGPDDVIVEKSECRAEVRLMQYLHEIGEAEEDPS